MNNLERAKDALSRIDEANSKHHRAQGVYFFDPALSVVIASFFHLLHDAVTRETYEHDLKELQHIVDKLKNALESTKNDLKALQALKIDGPKGFQEPKRAVNGWMVLEELYPESRGYVPHWFALEHQAWAFYRSKGEKR